MSTLTVTYKQSYTLESCQNEISTNKSIDSAHCETLSQCQQWKCCLTPADDKTSCDASCDFFFLQHLENPRPWSTYSLSCPHLQ